MRSRRRSFQLAPYEARTPRLRRHHHMVWFRRGLVGLVAISANLILCVTVVLAGPPQTFPCLDANNNDVYSNTIYDGGIPYWFTQVYTANEKCGTYNARYLCPEVYQTEGGKGNISTAGNPYTWDNTSQHVLQWITARESSADCTNSSQTCWLQTGWAVGTSGNACGGSGISTGTTPQVYVEIYDDSTAPCYVATYGNAPANASYDGRFDTTLSNGLHRYEVFFEVPGSGNIQTLGWGDFHDLDTAELAASEAWANPASPGDTPYCPVVGQTNISEWNYFGQPATKSTFASSMNLYTSSGWQNWTNSVAPTMMLADAPYQLQPVSNFKAGNFTEWKTGGPQ